MRLRQKKSLIDQAAERAAGVVDSVRETVSDLVEEVEETLLPQLESAAHTAREEARARLAEARTKAAPYVAQGAAYAQERAGELQHRAAERAADLQTLAAVRAADLQVKAQSALHEASGGRVPAPPRKRSKLRTGVLVLGVAAVVGVAAKKLQAGSADTWHAAPVTTAPRPTPATSAASARPIEDDAAAAAPGEALADEAAEPRVPTTPDDPAEVVVLDEPIIDPAATDGEESTSKKS